MEHGKRPRGRRPAVAAGCLFAAVVTGGCGQATAKTATSPRLTPTSMAVAVIAATSTTEATTSVPAVTTPATTVPAATTTAATVAKQWVTVAHFSGTGDRESNTFTITGSPARVAYQSSSLFSLSIDTGDSFDDTIIGSCPAGGCTQQGAVHVLPGGWYFHVTGTVPATTYTVTLQEYR